MADVAEQFRSEGFAIIEGALDRAALAELTAALAPYEAGRQMGRNDFEGEKSQRVYSLIAKGPAFRRLAEHPRVVELLDRVLLPNYLLSTFQSIRLHPGENAQAWHSDDAFYLVPRPRTSPLGV